MAGPDVVGMVTLLSGGSHIYRAAIYPGLVHGPGLCIARRLLVVVCAARRDAASLCTARECRCAVEARARRPACDLQHGRGWRPYNRPQRNDQKLESRSGESL